MPKFDFKYDPDNPPKPVDPPGPEPWYPVIPEFDQFEIYNFCLKMNLPVNFNGRTSMPCLVVFDIKSLNRGYQNMP